MEGLEIDGDLIIERVKKISKALVEKRVSFDIYSVAALLVMGLAALAEMYKISYKEAAERAAVALKYVAEIMDERLRKG